MCPKNLQPLLGCKEITKSLRTASKHLAKKLAITMATDIEMLFAEINNGLDLLKPQQVGIVAAHVHKQQITDLTQEALKDFKGRTKEQQEWEGFHARTFRQEVKINLKKSHYESVEPNADRLIEINGLVIEKHSALYNQICRAILIGLDQVYADAQKIINGNFEDPVFNFKPADSPIDQSENQEVSLQIAAAKYLGDYQTEWTVKHYLSQKAKLDHFIAFMGNGDLATGGRRSLEQASANDVRKYKELLQSTPSNAQKKYPDLSVIEVAEAAKQTGDPLLGTTSINNYIQCVSTLYSWAAKELDYQGKNPFKGRTKRVSGKSKSDERHPFSRVQLAKLFGSPLYSGCQSLRSSHQKGETIFKDSSRYWVPLIGLYTGMRLQEILQLYVEDVYQASGVWVLDINTNHDDQKLKTDQSKRVIPIHDDLITAGLIEFRNRREGNKDQRLFPDAPLSGDGTYSSTFSKWFGRYLKKIDIKTNKTSFHSFRHNMKDFFRAAEISDELSEHYLGRLTGKTGEAYGSGHTTENFAKAVARIKFKDYLDEN